MTGPLVSVITTTWRRPKLLTEQCIPSVDAQTYAPIEHLIVIDGQDAELRGRLMTLGYSQEPGTGRRVVEFGRNWAGVGHEGHAGGAWLAAGEYVCYLDDDNTYQPEHVAVMVAELERAGVGFVCTAWKTPDGGVGGWTPPGTNRTDASSILHRRDLLRVASWVPGDGYAADGGLVDRWVARGVTWSFLPEPTMVYGGARGGVPEPGA